MRTDGPPETRRRRSPGSSASTSRRSRPRATGSRRWATRPTRAWVERDLDTYGRDAVSVIFRPSTPDCDSAAALRAKVDLARDRGLRRVDFYHYGLMRLDALDWIRTALTRADDSIQ